MTESMTESERRGADPTANVTAVLNAAIQRQDDLRKAESRHVREVAELRASHSADLREAESHRIDPIRAVDVGAVNRAAEVSTTVAQTLASQVANSAEALRVQVEATKTAAAQAVEATRVAAATALSAALEPIIGDVQDLRKTQYEQAGGKAQVVEARDATADTTDYVELWGQADYASWATISSTSAACRLSVRWVHS